MERLGEDVETGGGILSRFRLNLRRSLESNATHGVPKPIVYTEACGYGYRFGIAWQTSRFFTSPQPFIYVDLTPVDSTLGRLTMKMTVETEGPGYMTTGACLYDPVPNIFSLPRTEVSRTVTPPYSAVHLTIMNSLGFSLDRVTLSFTVSSEYPRRQELRDTSESTKSYNHDNEHSLQLQQALNNSLDNGSFIDTKIYGFSCRSQSGRVSRPVPVFAASAVLSAQSLYFDTMFSKPYFSESSLDQVRDNTPKEQHLSTHDYDYDSDSDLEVVEDTSDIITSDSQEASGVCRTIHVADIAHKTLRALVWYFYTGQIAFSGLKSSEKISPGSQQGIGSVRQETSRKRPPPCSPKSMYRLADKYGIKELEDRAFDMIREMLNEDNIIEEVFSTFTSRYNKIRDMEIDFLCSKLNSPKVAEALPEMIAKFGQDSEDVRHPNFDVLAALVKKLIRGRFF